MRYVPRRPTIEAEPVQLAGSRMMAFMSHDGRAALCDEPTFYAFFEVEETGRPNGKGQRTPAPVTTSAPAMAAHKPGPKPHKPGPGRGRGGELSPLRVSVLACIKDAARTTAEIVYHVREESGGKDSRVHALLHYMKKSEGILAHREEPETHLDKWYLTEKGKCKCA